MAYTGQDPKVISVFEIVSSYFVDCYFNHIWHSARVNRVPCAARLSMFGVLQSRLSKEKISAAQGVSLGPSAVSPPNETLRAPAATLTIA